MNITFIVVKNTFEGIHYYPQAPDEVKYLRQPHRHIFHIESEIEVFHDDRELEFIMVKHRIDEFFDLYSELKSMSCEMIANKLQRHLKTMYPLPAEYKINGRDTRIVNVKVFEDGENGVYVKEVVE